MIAKKYVIESETRSGVAKVRKYLEKRLLPEATAALETEFVGPKDVTDCLQVYQNELTELKEHRPGRFSLLWLRHVPAELGQVQLKLLIEGEQETVREFEKYLLQQEESTQVLNASVIEHAAFSFSTSPNPAQCIENYKTGLECVLRDQFTSLTYILGMEENITWGSRNGDVLSGVFTSERVKPIIAVEKIVESTAYGYGISLNRSITQFS